MFDYFKHYSAVSSERSGNSDRRFGAAMVVHGRCVQTPSFLCTMEVSIIRSVRRHILKQTSVAAGALSEATASTLDGAALMVAAGAGSLAVGVPLAVMPAPLLAAGGLAMFLDSNAMRDYLLFVAGSLGTGGAPSSSRLKSEFGRICLQFFGLEACQGLVNLYLCLLSKLQIDFFCDG